jgi:hypothetical protein
MNSVTSSVGVVMAAAITYNEAARAVRATCHSSQGTPTAGNQHQRDESPDSVGPSIVAQSVSISTRWRQRRPARSRAGEQHQNQHRS